MCDQEISKTKRLKPATGLWKYNHNELQHQKNKKQILFIYRHKRDTSVGITVTDYGLDHITPVSGIAGIYLFRHDINKKTEDRQA